jgi:hypothetical protein
MLGVPFPLRMTAIRLPDGGVWLHSPVAATEARVSAVRGLGPVAHLVAPDRFHHLHLGPWQERFPEARLWAPPGLAKRREDLSFTGELDDAAPEAWRDVIDQVVFGGSRFIAEVVFLHRPSRTLLVTDIVQNHAPEADGVFWRMVKRWNGIAAPDGGCPLDWRLTVRDRAAARRAAKAILGWDFDRLVLCHGRCVPTGAHAFVERAFAWLV